MQQKAAVNPYAPIKDPQGGILELDLTERKRIQADLHYWGVNNSVYCLTDDKCTIVKYELTGDCQPVCSTHPEFQFYKSDNEKRYAFEVEQVIKNGNMTCFVLIKDYLIIGGKVSKQGNVWNVALKFQPLIRTGTFVGYLRTPRYA
jgi:hypothetical protein